MNMYLYTPETLSVLPMETTDKTAEYGSEIIMHMHLVRAYVCVCVRIMLYVPFVHV